MTTLYCTMGVPGSGKSTWAKSFLHPEGNSIVIVSPDAIRQELSGDASNQNVSGEAFRIAHERVAHAIGDPGDVIFDATSTTRRARLELLDLAYKFAARAELHVFDTPLPVALVRNSGRDRVVPDAVIYRMFGQFTQSLSQIGYEDWNSIHFHRS